MFIYIYIYIYIHDDCYILIDYSHLYHQNYNSNIWIND